MKANFSISTTISTALRLYVQGFPNSSTKSASARSIERQHQSVAELEQAIYDYLAIHNHNPIPFVWTATATAILEKTARAKQTLETVRAGTKC